MENSLTIKTEQIKVIQGSIDFPEYENIKKEALQLAEHIQTIEVTDENLKQSKKLLAAVNKRLKELEDERIRIKRTMLEPYQIFEGQVKDIVGIVKEADKEVRQQVKDLEEMERQEKKDALLKMFEQRKTFYTLGDLIPFDDFLQAKHLNKTASIEKTEVEMVEFLERTEKDVKVMQNMPDVEAHVAAYLQTYDLALAMTQVQGEKDRKQKIEASKAAAKAKPSSFMKTFIVYDEKDFMLVEMYMKNNKIKFEMKEGM
jgi:hypothetical protein